MSYSTDFNQKRNVVRLKIGDTVPTSELLQDAEIDFFLSEASDNVLLACLNCCEAILSQMANNKEKISEEDLTIVDKRYENYSRLASRFRMLYEKSVEGTSSNERKVSQTIPVTGIVGL